MNHDYFWLSKMPFARLEPHLPSDTRGKPSVDDRRVICGIVDMLKSGGRWIDAPAMVGLFLCCQKGRFPFLQETQSCINGLLASCRAFVEIAPGVLG